MVLNLPDSIITCSRPLGNTVKMTIDKNGRSGDVTTGTAAVAESDDDIIDILILLEHIPVRKVKVSRHSLVLNLHGDLGVLDLLLDVTQHCL